MPNGPADRTENSVTCWCSLSHLLTQQVSYRDVHKVVLQDTQDTMLGQQLDLNSADAEQSPTAGMVSDQLGCCVELGLGLVRP